MCEKLPISDFKFVNHIDKSFIQTYNYEVFIEKIRQISIILRCHKIGDTRTQGSLQGLSVALWAGTRWNTDSGGFLGDETTPDRKCQLRERKRKLSERENSHLFQEEERQLHTERLKEEGDDKFDKLGEV